MAKKQTTQIIKPKMVYKPKLPIPQKSKGIEAPWEVWTLNTENGYYDWRYSFKTKKEAELCIKKYKYLQYPIITFIQLPVVEYISTRDLI